MSVSNTLDSNCRYLTESQKFFTLLDNRVVWISEIHPCDKEDGAERPGSVNWSISGMAGA
jgi:hypothetical protein